MQITQHNLTEEEMGKALKATNGIVADCRVWLNSKSGKKAYISARINLGFISIQMFTVDFESRENAEDYLNTFEFEVKYEVMGCECE